MMSWIKLLRAQGLLPVVAIVAMLMLMWSCSPNKFLENGDTMLETVKMRSLSPDVSPSSLKTYVRQRPNTKWFNLWQAPLALYSLSPVDTTKRSSHFWRRLGEAPVVYSEEQTANTCTSLTMALKDRGYLQARVDAKVTTNHKKKRTAVEYILNPGQPYIVSHITRTANTAAIDSIIQSDISSSLLYSGMRMDASVLDKERSRLTSMLRDHGYYLMLKNYFHYDVDTLDGSSRVSVHLYCDVPTEMPAEVASSATATILENSAVNPVGQVFHIDSVIVSPAVPFRRGFLRRQLNLRRGDLFSENGLNRIYRSLMNLETVSYVSIRSRISNRVALSADTTRHSQSPSYTPFIATSAQLDTATTRRDLTSAHNAHTFAHNAHTSAHKDSALAHQNPIYRDSVANGNDSAAHKINVAAHSNNFAGLPHNNILGYISRDSIPLCGNPLYLPCVNEDISILMRPINTFGIEVEGTNTAGNLGAALNLLYTNRNLFRGAEVWTTKLHAAYEAISGLEGYSDQNYFELGIETKLTFPSLLVPFHLLGRQAGNTTLSLQWNTQERPEFHRRVLTALWSYQWGTHSGRVKQRLDLPSLNYVYMPWISATFRRDYLEATNYRSALIRYAYEDLLVFNTTYFHEWTSNRNGQRSVSPNTIPSRPTDNFAISQVRLLWSVESAGNLLWALSAPLGLSKNSEGYYKLFDVAYAQYLKFDIDASASFLINARNSLAIHGSLGLAQPYGNSLIVPFEKRYFGGGANGIRGWGVRELGPGNYKGEDGRVDFINQTGNLKLLLQAELRSNLFWKFSGAFFLDAGNIWTTRHYAVTGKGGQLQLSDFWKQIALSYGIGLRLNLDYFILRFDLGMKAINPAYKSSTSGYLPLVHPRFGRDATFHFAVGLPF